MINKIHLTELTGDFDLKAVTIFTYLLLFMLLIAFAFPARVSADANDFLKEYPFEEVYVDTSEVFTVVDVMPEIIGGLPALYKEIKYPRQAVNSGIEGRVFIQFIVETDGSISEPNIMRDLGAGTGDAAIAALENVEFTPGEHQGEKVRVRFSLPVTFKIQK